MFKNAPAVICVVLVLAASAAAQPLPQQRRIDNGNALACRNKGDMEKVLNVILVGQEAYMEVVAPLIIAGRCTQFDRGTAVVVLEITLHSPRFEIARVRRVGDSNEHWINAMYVK